MRGTEHSYPRLEGNTVLRGLEQSYPRTEQVLSQEQKCP
jgi:hypothetical protein